MLINEETIRNIVAESLKNILSEKTLLRLGNSNSQKPLSIPPSMDATPMDNPNMGDVPTEDPNATPMDGSNIEGGLNASPMDNSNMDGAADDMGGDPNIDGTTDDATDAAVDIGDADDTMGGDEEDDDSTISIINQLSDTDKEAVRSYAKSMLHRDEAQNGDNGEGMENPDLAPMGESFIFTKKQIQMIQENFGPMSDELSKEDDRKPLGKKKTNKISPNSPFNSPKFN